MRAENFRRTDSIKTHDFFDWKYFAIGNTSFNVLSQLNVINKKDFGKFTKKEPDALIVDSRNSKNINVIAVVEWKDTLELNSKNKIDVASKQCNTYCQIIGAKLGIITDGKDFYWINPNIKNGEIIYCDNEIFDNVDKVERTFDYIKDENGFELTTSVDFIKPSTEIFSFIKKVIDTIDEKSSQLKKLTYQNPTALAKTIWQDVWISKSASPEKALSTFIEIFMFKYLSDLKILTQNNAYTDIDFDTVLNKGKNGCLIYYFENVRNYIKAIFPENKDDNTTLINGMSLNPLIKEDNTTFYNILCKFKDFGNFKDIDPEFKSRLFEDFLKKSISKKNWGQFFTPRNIIKAIVNMSEIHKLQDGSNVGDPASGVGGFLLEPILSKRKNDFYFEGKILKSKINYFGFEKGFELEEKLTTILAKANFVIYVSELLKHNPTLTHEFANMFNSIFKIYTKSILGSLSEITENKYDLILSNPPYVTDGSRAYKKVIEDSGELNGMYKLLGVGIESLFVEKIINELKDGGTAFIILPAGIFSKENNKNLREFIANRCIVNGIISLPAGAFYTTPQKTFILSITKTNKKIKQKEPIFSYVVSNIGETLDTNRFAIEDNDLIEMAKEFRIFMLDKLEYSEKGINRCKIINIDDLLNHSWFIEDYWNEDEKISLGLEKEIIVMDKDSIEDEVIQLNKTLKQIKNQINKDFSYLEFENFELEQIIDFEIMTNDSSFTKSFVNEHKGNIPVYSASKDPFHSGYGFVLDNLNGIKYFDNCLTWNIDGSIGKAHYRKGRFSLSEKVIPLKLKKEYEKNIDYYYLKYAIETKVLKMGFNFLKKAGKGRIKNLKIPFPIKEEKPDINLQRILSEKYIQLEELKLKLKQHTEKLLNEYENDLSKHIF